MWYINRGGKIVGPLKPEDLKQMAEAGLIQPADLVRQEGSEKWVEAKKVKGMFPDEARWQVTPDPEPKPEPTRKPLKATYLPEAENEEDKDKDEPRVRKDKNRKKTNEEYVFFEEDGILVTSTRFVVPNQTFAMSGITSCKFSAESGKWKLHLVLLFLFNIGWFVAALALLAFLGIPGLLLSLLGLALASFGICFGKLCRYRTADKYWVAIGTAGSEVRALWNRDEKFIRRIVRAVTDAMIARG